MVLNNQTLTRASHELSDYKHLNMDEICAILRRLAPRGKQLRPCGSQVREPNRITRREINAIAQKIIHHNAYTLRELREILRGVTVGAHDHRTPSPRSVVKHIDPQKGLIFEYDFDNKSDVLVCDKKLGSGGYGTVYKCKSNYFGTVALKTYHGKSDRVIQDLEQELYMLSKVIPYKIYVGGFSKGIYYLVTEYIAGDNCAHKRLSNASILQLYKQLSRILKKRVHAKGIAHKDIKPDNIVYDAKKKEFVLVDWGLACFIDYKAREYACKNFPRAGTRDFLSPWLKGKIKGGACINGKEYIRNDWWALGITLYLLSRRELPKITSTARGPKIELKSTKNDELDRIIARLLDVKKPCL